MINSVRHGTELRRFARNRMTRLALVVVAAIPLLYGALYLWAFWNPTNHLDKLPVALVMQDRGATDSKGAEVTAGKEVADSLVQKRTVAWSRTSATEASVGLADGDYLAVVTIPPGFSEAVVSAGTEHPTTAPFEVRYNDASGYTARTLVSSVMREVRSAVSASLGEQLVGKLLIGFTDIHANLAKAADGAHQLASGAATARDGSADLATGASSLAQGADRLAAGAGQAHAGAARLVAGSADLAAGAHTAAGGAATLSNGLTTLRNSTAGLPAATRQLATGARQVADGNRQLATTVGGAADAVGVAAGQVSTAAGQASSARDALIAPLTEYVSAHPEDTQAARLLAQLKSPAFDTAVADVRAKAGQVQSAADQARSDTARLAAGADQVAQGNAQLAASTPGLVSGIAKAADGGAQLASGTGRLAGGADALHTGAGSLQTGLATLTTGSSTLATGAHQLSDGADHLHGGLANLADGATQLSQGLDDGLSQVPTYTDAQNKATSDVIADPVALDTSFSHEASGNGEGFAPYFIGLALYVGAMILWMVLRPISQRSLLAPVSATRVAFAGLQPAMVVGAAQVLLLIGVLVFALGLNAAHLAAVIGFMLVVSLAFITLQQAIGIAFGSTGRVLVLVLLMLQLTSAGGTYPSQLTPVFFQKLHALLPMTQVVNGLRSAITGDLDGRFWFALSYLVIMVVVCFGLGTLAAARNRVWTMTRLHPAISL